MASNLNFPDYFGYNWDAAYDCLLDWAASCDDATDVYFSISEGVQVVEEDLLIFTQLLQDVCEFQSEHQKTVRFFIVSVTTAP
ncbi:hypothetical protein LH51_17410 [Nitrincola sp. A-D6]|uniref:barstar family protein n=1 Tax=Nitrincola sp. A-D6 TaxID=1545442 RepID=UPI00051FC0B4|nr:barstar family protein [Nitrincola sp. A-D6]KGK41053.1 hypothetical protein LH51_17410 [Nitrincola sp. A-D6]